MGGHWRAEGRSFFQARQFGLFIAGGFFLGVGGFVCSDLLQHLDGLIALIARIVVKLGVGPGGP